MVRFNTKDGSSKKLNGDVTAWRIPADDSIDLAVTPVLLTDDLLFTLIPVDDFATKDIMSSQQIAEGSPILLSGYFYQFPGERRFQSIVRQGILSMVPDEPVTTTTGKPGTVYLCDVHIFNGNSGSPVMVTANWVGIEGYRLLGVVSGNYVEDENFNLEIATTVRGTLRANSGVAMVVPADLVKALLDGPELKGLREAYISQSVGTGKP
jgi:S1-C subfamily serine protease